jgi:hypothetical protein
MIERGKYDSITQFAAADKINESYVSRGLWLTLLAQQSLKAFLTPVNS